MDIDNSRGSAFRFCPWKYYEQYERKHPDGGEGVEPNPKPGEAYSPLQFGDRMHQLLETHYRTIQQGLPEPLWEYPAHLNGSLEDEAQLTMAAYRARYPDEQLNIVDVERTFRVALPNLCPSCYNGHGVEKMDAMPQVVCDNCGHMFKNHRHSLIGKIDLVTRDFAGIIDITDHKSEQRGAKSNLPQKWAARDQASLYLWAARKIYGGPVGNFYVNVITRQSPQGQVPPSFPEERQKLERTALQMEVAIRDIIIVADDIERYRAIFGEAPWPANRENCYGWGYCEYWPLHGYGEDVQDILEHRYQPKKEYLNLAGVRIIQ